MDFARFQKALLKLEGAGGSRALNNLLVKALLDPRSRPGNADPHTHDLLKMVALYRMGRIRELTALIERLPTNGRDLQTDIFYARALLAGGDSRKACALAGRFPVDDPQLSPALLSEALMMTGLCAAMQKDRQGMEMISTVARDRGVRSPLSFAVMDYLVSGAKPRLDLPSKLGVRDYFFLRLTGEPAPRRLLDMAEPALVYALAFDRASPPALRLAALERAARKGAIRADELARLYQEVAAQSARATRRSDAQTRALLLDGLTRASDPRHQARIIDTLMINARKTRLSFVIGPVLAPFVAQMQPGPALDGFALRAVEVALLAGDMQLAEKWFLFVQKGGRRAYAAAEWLPLADLVRLGVVPAGEGAQMALRMGRARRLGGVQLHKLASALEALALDVPIPLWNLAGKTPQPNKGALPPTGALSRLTKAGEADQKGEVLLQALAALGRNHADEMHLIALKDLVKTLHKAGFQEAASQFAFEALYNIWPTGATRSR